MPRLLHAVMISATVALLASVGAVGTGAALGASIATGAGGTRAAPAAYEAIDGSGSSWAALAIDQWTSTLATNGITINYSPIGSATGRDQFIQGLDDFAGSDPPFRNGGDKLAQTPPEISHFGYSYLPDTAGGTAFMYHLVVAGHQITNLRLTGKEIMEIFTGAITNWDDPQITKTYGAALPNIPITPVVRTDGSGATFFFTRWMAHVFPAQWNAFCHRVTQGRVNPPCPETEFYPTNGSGWSAKGENGSTAVANYITASYGNGAIGYDEYAYAINSHYPVVQVLNPAGYFVLPTASNVAVALTQARINEDPRSKDFLQQNLDKVYSYTDPRSYPLSSYSYLIVPREGTSVPPRFNGAKGATLSTLADYLLCAGQQNLAQLGYSPLPKNLVQGGLLQSDHIPGHVKGPSPQTLHGCANPTINSQGQLILLKDAPYPNKCQKVGEPLTCNPSAPGSGNSSTSPSPSGSASPSASSSGIPTPGTTGSNPANPGGTGPTQGPVPGSSSVAGQVVTVASESASPALLSVLTVVVILAAIVMPPVLGASLRRRRRQTPGRTE